MVLKLNLKSNIFKISIVIALIFILIPAIAAEDTDGDVLSKTQEVVLVGDNPIYEPGDYGGEDFLPEPNGGPDDLIEDPHEQPTEQPVEEPIAGTVTTQAPNTTTNQIPVSKGADLQVDIIPHTQQVEDGNIAVWAVVVSNWGPDVAKNVNAIVDVWEGNLYYITSFATTGEFYVFDNYSTWVIGDMEPDTYEILYLICMAKDVNSTIYAYVYSDTFDPVTTNNLDLAFVDVVRNETTTIKAAADEEVSQATMPAAGNPIAMALLALISLAGISFGRKL